MLLTWWFRHMVGGLLPSEKHIIAVALQNWERQGGGQIKETGYEDLKNRNTLWILFAHGFHSNRLHALVVYLAGALSEVGGFSVKGSHFDQERWTKAVSVNGSFFHWGGYQWNVCSVSWYFISFHIHLYTSTINISIYPCYDIIFCKSSIITGMPFKNTFAKCFKFPNDLLFSYPWDLMFFRGLEVHVAGFEVPHCRGGVDPASDWTRVQPRG